MRPISKAVAIVGASLLLIGGAPAPDVAAPSAPASASALPNFQVASEKDVRALVAAMLTEMKPGQGFLWRPLVRDGSVVAAVEVWKKPGLPAVHPSEAEYAIVLEGAGTLVAGGTLVEPVTRREGLVEGARIEGGITRTLGPGDVLLVPAGVPHWFGVNGDRLVLLGTKLPTSR